MPARLSPRRSPGRAKRSLGQRFLVSAPVQKRIVAACGAGERDEVLEIGPGRGALTRHLVQTGARVVAVELDDQLADRLRADYRGNPAVRIVHGDVLREELPALAQRWSRTRVVGNIPYNITTPIVFRLLQPPCPADILLMVQAEVARRMTAPPGTKEYGALTVGVSLHARAERLFNVPGRAFRPLPRVESTVVRLVPRSPPALTPAETDRVRRFVRAAFSWRRKQLGTILRGHPDLRHARDAAATVAQSRSLDLALRPEQLAPEDFLALSAVLEGTAGG